MNRTKHKGAAGVIKWLLIALKKKTQTLSYAKYLLYVSFE